MVTLRAVLVVSALIGEVSSHPTHTPAGDGFSGPDRRTKEVKRENHTTSSPFEEIAIATNGRFPYIASIKNAGSHEHTCTGILIAPEFVLTAAHCVDPSSLYSAGKRPIVHLGPTNVMDQDDPRMEVFVVEWSKIHERWINDKRQRSPFNIAILKLPVASMKTTPIMLVDHFNLSTGEKLMALGWGSGDNEAELGSGVLSSLKMEPQEFITDHQCNRSTLWNGEIEETLICAISYKRQASCVVNWGSPLIIPDMPRYVVDNGRPNLDFVIGFNVDGAVCGVLGKPHIFIDLRIHHDWIQKKVEVAKLELDEL